MTENAFISTGSSAKKVSDDDTLTVVIFLLNFHWRI